MNQLSKNSLVSSGYESVMINRTYMIMTLALIVTGITAYAVGTDPVLFNKIFFSSMVPIGLFLGQLFFAFMIGKIIDTVAPSMAVVLFILYSASVGLLFSGIFRIYAMGTIYTAFFISASMFLALSLFGAVTKKDLTGVGNFMFMGLIGIIIASVINIFTNSPAIQWAVNYLGVIIFAGLTAYDTQRIKVMSHQIGNDSTLVTKFAILGAFALYLDFINMFLFILRILDSRR